MKHRLVLGPARIPRRTFMAATLGTHPGMHGNALKQYLHEAELIPSPTQKLELVMVEDYAHFTELIAYQGLLLARGEGEPIGRPSRWAFLSRILRR